MEVVLPYGYNKNNTSVTSIDFINYPYLVSTKKETYVMTREEIIMRLESAIYDKDWAAVELLLEDLQVSEIEEDDFTGDYE
tara:strand:+ start:606 stop:848 length:243 start_codon:yes stop_codon:yes gene_type:complete